MRWQFLLFVLSLEIFLVGYIVTEFLIEILIIVVTVINLSSQSFQKISCPSNDPFAVSSDGINDAGNSGQSQENLQNFVKCFHNHNLP